MHAPAQRHPKLPAGSVTEYAAGVSARSGPDGITAGPGGNLWFVEADGGRIGRFH